MKRAIALTVLLAAALTLSACGGGGDETESPTEWADKLCTDLGEWKSSLQNTASSFSGNISPENAQDAADEVGDATETLVGELQDLGRPDTESGQQAQDDVDELSEKLQTASDEVQRAADGVSSLADVPQAASTIAAAAREVTIEVTTTLTSLAQLDAGGELSSAVSQSEACNSLKSS